MKWRPHLLYALTCTFVVVLCELGWPFLVDTRTRLALAKALNASQAGNAVLTPQRVVLVSYHGGAKFWGVRPFMLHNKLRFCRNRGLSCFVDTSECQYLGRTDAITNWDRCKYELLLAAFNINTVATGAFWIDGDCWLFDRKSHDFDRLLALVRKTDIVIGRDRNNSMSARLTLHRKCDLGVNSGIFWVRRSKWTIAWLKTMVKRKGMWYDQCVINHDFIMVPKFRKHVRVLPFHESRMLQCRTRCWRHPELCCTQDSWLVHWPAHEPKDLFLRVWEQLLGFNLEPVMCWFERVVCLLLDKISNYCFLVTEKASGLDLLFVAIFVALGTVLIHRCLRVVLQVRPWGCKLIPGCCCRRFIASAAGQIYISLWDHNVVS